MVECFTNTAFPKITVQETDIRLLNLETRLPFEFGVTTLTKLPHCFVRVRCLIDGEEATGLAADHLPPRWFMKDPDRSLAAEMEAMVQVVQRACEYGRGTTARSVFSCWVDIYEAQKEWGESSPYPPLLWAFGATFLERALIDAYCRAAGISFHTAVHKGKLGIRPEYVYPELSEVTPSTYLPNEASTSVAVRHTVGASDPLHSRGSVDPNDGLPVTLEENIQHYGLNRFKIKVQGEVDEDYERVRAILRVAEESCSTFSCTLDANEQYRSVSELRDLIGRLRGDDSVHRFDERLLFIEQPFPRESALSDRVGRELSSWTDRPPVIIDESDGRLESCGVALDAGYRGTSHKNCKGVFKGIINACLIEHRRRQHPDREYVLSAEDLTTIGPVSLLQDLDVVALLGMSHVERNGQHFFRGLSAFPEDLQASMSENHPDLYRRHEDGFLTLDIAQGKICLESVLGAPFGYACEFDATQFDDPRAWNPPA